MHYWEELPPPSLISFGKKKQKGIRHQKHATKKKKKDHQGIN